MVRICGVTPEIIVVIDLQIVYLTPQGSVTSLMSELQAPVDPDCADCEGVMEIVQQI